MTAGRFSFCLPQLAFPGLISACQRVPAPGHFPGHSESFWSTRTGRGHLSQKKHAPAFGAQMPEAGVWFVLHALAKCPPGLLGRVKSFRFQHRAKREEINNFTIARKIILDKWRPFTGRRASDAGGGFFQCLLRSLPAALSGLTQAPGFAGGLTYCSFLRRKRSWQQSAPPAMVWGSSSSQPYCPAMAWSPHMAMSHRRCISSSVQPCFCQAFTSGQ